MQQAVTSTQVSLSTPFTTSIVISSLASRHVLVRVKLARLFDKVVDRCVAAFNTTASSLSSTATTFSCRTSVVAAAASAEADLDAIIARLVELLKRPDSVQFVVVDPLIEPFLLVRRERAMMANRSFFENKFGFSEEELLSSEYREPMTTRQRRTLLNSLGIYYETNSPGIIFGTSLAQTSSNSYVIFKTKV